MLRSALSLFLRYNNISNKQMNYHISSQITNMISIAQAFVAGCKMAAMQDDGHIDGAEAKQLKSLTDATERFIHELQKAKDR